MIIMILIYKFQNRSAYAIFIGQLSRYEYEVQVTRILQ